MANELQTKLDAIKLDKDTNLLPENLKKNITCLGVTGTYEGSSGTVEGIKQFATVEEMQADTTAKEGDLAVVYRSEIQNAAVDSKFQVATFPDTVVLDTVLTNRVEFSYRATDSSVMFDCWGSLNRSRFSMDYYSESGEVRIEYTSSDGITYTRTDTTGNPVDFGTEIYCEMAEMWNDAIGKFIQIGGNIFEGLFVGESIIKQIQPIKMSTMTINTETNVPNISDVITLNYNVDSFAEKIYPMVKHIDTLEGMTSHSRYPYCVYLKDNNTVSIIADGTTSDSVMLACPVFVDNTFKGLVAASYGVTNFYEWQFNLNTGEYIGRNNITATDYTTFGSSTFKYYYTTVFNDYYYVGNMDWTGSSFSYIYSLLYNNTSYSADTLSMTGVNGIMYFLAPTQLTAITEYVYGKEFYGKNGIEIGTLQINTNLTKEQLKTKAEIWNTLNNVKLDASITDLSGAFSNMTTIESIPMLDTSNVTDMSTMFQSCSNLMNIPLLDTVNVVDASFMFNACTNLTAIPLFNTTNVTNMTAMLSNCTNLTEIPSLDTSSVTTMTDMFSGCASLSDESLNNILAMCTNAVKITSNKTLKYIGLTSEQATKCTTLSNYSAFTSAGWTTGY